MDNPIQFSDLFSEGIKPGVEDLRNEVQAFHKDLKSLLDEFKKAGAGMTESFSGVNVTTKEGRDSIKEQAAAVEQLYTKINALESANAKLEAQIKKMGATHQKTSGNITKSNKQTSVSWYEVTNGLSTLEHLIQKTDVDISKLLTTQKQYNIVANQGKIANESLEGSYNQLAAQYNIIKTILNGMSAEMRNATNVGKVWEGEALRIMNAMKQMQEATGKHTLSVGDYGKALNGLSISTQQVLREMPTLANSLQQFFIAISNNVPIFVDNLKRVQQATGSWAKAMQGVLASVFSWQTLLLVVLTILPRIAKAIHDKRKAQQEDNKVTKEAITLTTLLREAELAMWKAVEEDAAKLRTLIAITQDYNRSQEDRIMAAQTLKNIYKDQLADYSAEEIALGKAKTALDNITESLQKQAQARAYLGKITEAYSKLIEAELKLKNIEEDDDGALAYLWKEYQRILSLEDPKKVEKEMKRWRKGMVKARREQLDAYIENKQLVSAYSSEIDYLTKRISAEGLFVPGDSDKKAKATISKVKDYWYEYAESLAQLIDDEEQRETRLAELRIDKAKDTYEALLQEMRDNHTLTEDQEKYINGIIKNLELEKQNEILTIRQKYADKWEKEAYERDLKAIKDRYNAQIATASKTMLQAGEKYNKAVESNSYRQAKKEGAIYKQSVIEKLNLEAELQREVLKFRRETGRISEEEYQMELAKIAESLTKSIANLESKRKGRRMNLWTMIFGKTTTDGKGNVYKELSAEQNQFISAFNGAIKTSMQYMNEWMSKRIEMAQIAVDMAHKETETAQSALDLELQARANGYANNVQLARREYEEKLAIEREAIEERKRLERIQEGINTAQQISSLITATANLWASYSSIPYVGMALAIAATTAMWGSFAAAKITAAQMAKAKTYGEGGMEYIDYGGSHASGHDVDFGRTKDGRPRRIEKGEAVAVINKRNVNKYGVNTIGSIIDSLNRGTFEKQFGSGVVDSTNDLASMYALAFSGLGANGADLSTVERGIQTLVEQGSVKVVPTPYGRIEYRGNNKRIIRN